MGFYGIKLLVLADIAVKLAIEILSCPIYSMVIFHRYISLLEGIWKLNEIVWTIYAYILIKYMTYVCMPLWNASSIDCSVYLLSLSSTV